MTVEDLMEIALQRVAQPQCSLLEAVAATQRVIVNRLLLKRSDLVHDRLMVYLSANESETTLPPEYVMPDGLPEATGIGPLHPMPKGIDRTATTYATAGTPRFQEVKGRTLTVIPPTAADLTLYVPAFVRPRLPDDLSDDLPFYGAFDNAYLEGTVAVLAGGLAVMSDAAFVALIESQVDQVLLAKSMADEQACADSINYWR